MSSYRPYRWGLSLACYHKFAGFLTSSLPVRIPLTSPSQASFIRDAITYAEDNDLPGKELKGRVKVSLESPKLAVLDWKNPNLKVDVSGSTDNISKPISIFDIIGMCEEGEKEKLVGRYTILEGTNSLEDIKDQYELSYSYISETEAEFHG
jgi:hypothetical protein